MAEEKKDDTKDDTVYKYGCEGKHIRITGGHQGKPSGDGKIIPPQGGSGTAPPQGSGGKPPQVKKG